MRAHRERIVGSQAGFLVGAEDDRRPDGGLLEGLEQGSLGVVVHAVGGFDDGDTRAALERQQRQLTHEVTHATRLRRVVRRADHDLTAPSLRTEPVQVGVRPRLDKPAAPAGATGPHRRVGRLAEQPGRQVECERRLADARRTADEHRVR